MKEYFANYFLHQADVTFDMAGNEVEYHDCRSEPWKVTLVDTGEETMTGGRLLQVSKYLESARAVLHDLRRWIGEHRYLCGNRLSPGGGFEGDRRLRAAAGALRPLVVEGGRALSFAEKPQAESGLINGGFFVLEPGVLELIDGAGTVWEKEPMESLAADRSARRVGAPRLLAADGHASRQAAPGGSVGFGRRAVEALARLRRHDGSRDCVPLVRRPPDHHHG